MKRTLSTLLALSSLLFGSVMTAAYSFAGGLLSFFVMLLLQRSKGFSPVGVSLAGGVAHNIGQILVAMLVLENVRLVVYLPVLLLSGVVTGVLIGLVAGVLLRHLPQAPLPFAEIVTFVSCNSRAVPV